jgi:hypothetical protein
MVVRERLKYRESSEDERDYYFLFLAHRNCVSLTLYENGSAFF